MLSAWAAVGWQNDVDLTFRRTNFFSPDGQLTFLPSAQAELRLGRYLVGDKNHGWFGGAEGDVVLLSFSRTLAWRWHLNMETLADDNNDIYFRLVQVYYQTRTGISWLLGPGVWTMAYQHRCSHGADQALSGRILIRSGINTSYHWPLRYKSLSIDLRASVDAYIIGQNADLDNQARGGSQLNGQVMWPIRGSWFMLIGLGVGAELMSAGQHVLYNLSSAGENFRLESLFGTKFALRYDAGGIKNDYGLHFSQVVDPGLTNRQAKHSSLTFDINFYW